MHELDAALVDCSCGVENETQQVRHRSDRNRHVRSTEQQGVCGGVLAPDPFKKNQQIRPRPCAALRPATGDTAGPPLAPPGASLLRGPRTDPPRITARGSAMP